MTQPSFVLIPDHSLFSCLETGRAVLSSAWTLDHAGFSEIVVDAGSLRENLELASIIIGRTESLKIAISLPVFETTPLEAGERIAELDAESGGRVSVHASLRNPPAGLDHAEALRMADEFVVLMKRFWANNQPISFEGGYYRCENALIAQSGPRRRIPIWVSATSGSVVQFAGRHADVFLLRPGTHADIAEQIARIAAARSQFGRTCCPRYVLAADLPATGDALLRHAEIGVTDFAVRSLEERAAVAAAQAPPITGRERSVVDLPRSARDRRAAWQDWRAEP